MIKQQNIGINRFKQTLAFTLAIVLLGFIYFYSDVITASATQEESASKLERYNEAIMTMNRSGIETDAQKEELLRYLTDRKTLLLDTMDASPKLIKDYALPAEVIDELPPEATGLVERYVELNGSLSVLAAVDSSKENEVYRYSFKVKNESGENGVGTNTDFEIVFIEPPAGLVSSPDVTIRGMALDTKVVLESASADNLEINAAYPEITRGDRGVLVVRMNFVNDQSLPFAEADIENMMFNNADSIDEFFRENSYGQVSLSGDATTLLTTSYNSNDSGCNLDLITDAGNAAALSAGYDIDSYSHVIYLFPHTTSCTAGTIGTWAGMAQVTGNLVWVNGYDYEYIYSHELGHNLGLVHSNRINCGANSIDDYSLCTNTEYGDWYDNMGCCSYYHFNAAQKTAVHWLTPDQIQTVSQPGTYTVHPLENNDSSVKAIKILKNNTSEYYFFEYRRATGFDALLPSGATKGAVGHIAADMGYSTKTKLLDFTPGNDTNDVALSDGATFHDSINSISVTQIAHDSNSVTLQVDVVPPRDYFWSWYDNVNSRNWILLANPASRTVPLNFDLAIQGQKMDLASYVLYGADCAYWRCRQGEVPPGMSLNLSFPSLVGGPVKASSLSGDSGIASQRILWGGGSSIEEVLANDREKLSSHFYWTWYDQQSQGMANWVMIANPNDYPVYFEVTIAGEDPNLTLPGDQGIIAPGESGWAVFPGVKGGPVEVRTWKNSDKLEEAQVMASQRVLSGGGVAFNEMPGIPVEELKDRYLWTWYDAVGSGGNNWVMLANPDASAPLYYEITIGGEDPDPTGDTDHGTIGPGEYVYPTFPGQTGGPVEVRAWRTYEKLAPADLIASQRIIWGPSFGETHGYPYDGLVSDYHWTWYDQSSPGALNWVMISNPTGNRIYYEITVAGLNLGAGSTGILEPGRSAFPAFPTKMGGPVEVKAWQANPDNSPDMGLPADILASQRVLWNGFFNETLGSVIN